MNSESRNIPFLTDDGSHSLRSLRFGVSYHSTHGAVGESEHVFIDAGLSDLIRAGRTEITVMEMGFGTGLNALLVRKLAAEHQEIVFHYLTCERFPLSLEQVSALNYPEIVGIDQQLFLQLHSCDWGMECRLARNFYLTKLQGDFLSPAFDNQYGGHNVDVFFYDAFAPGSQPELWSLSALQRCHSSLKDGGRLVTYCAKGQFKRDLRSIGFTVEALPGPPGKREMTRATT